MYSTPLKLRVTVAVPFTHLPHNVIFRLSLLLVSECLYRRQPRPFHRQHLVGGKSLYRPHALSDNLGHCMELSCNDLFLYLGRCAPEHPMPEETKGEQLDWEMYMESVIVVC